MGKMFGCVLWGVFATLLLPIAIIVDVVWAPSIIHTPSGGLVVSAIMVIAIASIFGARSLGKKKE